MLYHGVARENGSVDRIPMDERASYVDTGFLWMVYKKPMDYALVKEKTQKAKGN